MKKTLVLGASPKPGRYSALAVSMLLENGIETVAVGQHEGQCGGLKIETGRREIEDIDTVTLYVGPQNQKHWKDYVLKLRPRRIIFNPGTENPELKKLAEEQGIQTEEACTLVMLRTGQY